jgi:hypothetical protein
MGRTKEGKTNQRGQAVRELSGLPELTGFVVPWDITVLLQ